jgi:hypothetical protein
MSFSTSDEEALPVRTVENFRRTCAQHATSVTSYDWKILS